VLYPSYGCPKFSAQGISIRTANRLEKEYIETAHPTSEMSLVFSGAELGWRWHWVPVPVVPHCDVADLEIGLGLHRY